MIGTLQINTRTYLLLFLSLILLGCTTEDGAAVIDIDWEIGGSEFDGEQLSLNTTPALKEKIREITDIKANEIFVNINSPGGFVNDGLAIHDALAQHLARIITKV